MRVRRVLAAHPAAQPGNTIKAGTSEILRDIIAERVLGLPRCALVDFAFPRRNRRSSARRPVPSSRPTPTVLAGLADLGWTGVFGRQENGGAGLGFLEEAILFEEMERALTHAPYWSTVAVTLPALPADLQAEVASGAASWTLATGPLVADLDTATRVAYVGGDAISELEDSHTRSFERRRTRPLRRVSGGEAGRKLASSELLPRLRSRSLTALALEGVRRRREGARAGRRLCGRATAVRQADRHLPGDLASARNDADGARARQVAGVLLPPGVSARTTIGRRLRQPPPSHSAPTQPSRPASGRSRCMAASASRGSTCSTASTSAPSGSSPGRRPGPSFARR